MIGSEFLDDAIYIASSTRQEAISVFNALLAKLLQYTASKQDFETAYAAATYACRDEIRKLIDQITKDHIDLMPDPHSIGDTLWDGDGSGFSVTSGNLDKENISSKSSMSYRYTYIPMCWKDHLRVLYVERSCR